MKRKVFLTLAIICFIIAIGFALFPLWSTLYDPMPNIPKLTTTVPTIVTDPPISVPIETREPVDITADTEEDPLDTVVETSSESIPQMLDTEPESETGPPAYMGPIDFPAWRMINSDIYAWLTIPETYIDYPVLQNPKSDGYYLRRSVTKKYHIAGSLFTEHSYNGTDFTDRVTIIYGHQMRGESYFGKLQEYYSNAKTFKAYKTIMIYLPDRELRYEVFAALPYSNRHILSFYNKFKYESSMTAFLDTVYNARAFGINIDRSVKIKDTDRILILSTCLKGDNTKRFIVLSRLVGEIKY